MQSFLLRAAGEKPPEAEHQREAQYAEQNTRPLRNRPAEGKQAASAVAPAIGPMRTTVSAGTDGSDLGVESLVVGLLFIW